jgi:hypothetical protein
MKRSLTVREDKVIKVRKDNLELDIPCDDEENDHSHEYTPVSIGTLHRELARPNVTCWGAPIVALR